jgi:hypothetical protein
MFGVRSAVRLERSATPGAAASGDSRAVTGRRTGAQ